MAAAVALILLRSFVYLRFEQLSFDSDQAIVGLMAKHLSEGRAFPLFFYGQAYMLGVEAWVAAPFFFLLGPTVDALRLSLLAWNIFFAVLLIWGLRRAGMGWWVALVPALYFLAAPPSVARELIEAQGGMIEPFVYILVLWWLRERPLWFGAMLAVGFLNREFTLYAVPVLIGLQFFSGELDRARARGWMLTAVSFFAVWESIEALKQTADLLGPGTRGQLLRGFSGSEISNLLGQFNWRSSSTLGRILEMGRGTLGWFVGAHQVESNLPVPDRSWLAWAAAVFMLVLLVRLGVLLAGRASRSRSILPLQFPLYLLGVGLVAALAFVAAKPILDGYSKYVVLALLIPIGLTAAILIIEPHPMVRRAVIVLTVCWAALSVVDHVRVLAEFVGDPPPNLARGVTDELMARDVRFAEAGYWQAYKLTFLAGERVRIASSDVVRIDEYQRLAHSQPGGVPHLSERPCPGGEPVGNMYLCQP